MSKSVGYGEQFAINLDEPLSKADRQYLADRDPRYRDVLGGTTSPQDVGVQGSEPSLSTGTATATVTETPPYEEWHNNELQNELAERGLSTSGNKAEMVARLQQDDQEA
jgi:hypothetical protein